MTTHGSDCIYRGRTVEDRHFDGCTCPNKVRPLRRASRPYGRDEPPRRCGCCGQVIANGRPT
jgi:hypothetical protein